MVHTVPAFQELIFEMKSTTEEWLIIVSPQTIRNTMENLPTK